MLEPIRDQTAVDAVDVLVVNDNEDSLRLYQTILHSPAYRIHLARSGAECLRLIEEKDFALVLLDVAMPGMDGFEVARSLRANHKTAALPIIFLTSHRQNEIDTIEGYRLGAVDYLFTPVSAAILRGKVAVFAELHRAKLEIQKQDLELRYLSTHDALTGLYNRAYFDIELSRLARGREFPICVVIADLDGLKRINDSEGHQAGDKYIKDAAEQLRVSFRGSDVVARIGGDEFAVLLAATPNNVAQELVERLQKSCISGQDSNGRAVAMSLGMATANSGSDLVGSVRLADERMYANKKERKLNR